MWYIYSKNKVWNKTDQVTKQMLELPKKIMPWHVIMHNGLAENYIPVQLSRNYPGFSGTHRLSANYDRHRYFCTRIAPRVSPANPWPLPVNNLLRRKYKTSGAHSLNSALNALKGNHTCFTSSLKSFNASLWCNLTFFAVHFCSSVRCRARISWITSSTCFAPDE